MPAFTEDWTWCESTQDWRRLIYEDGQVYEETMIDTDVLEASVRDQERMRHNPADMERVVSVPAQLMEQMAAAGVPVFDPDCGNEALLEHIMRHRSDYSRLITSAGKGM